MFAVMDTLLNALPGDPAAVHMARDIATLPMRMGGLGLQSAQRMAEPAYWASWADALPMLAKRLPNVSQNIVHHLVGEEGTGCLVELARAAANLDHQGFVGRPSWEDLRRGTRPPPRGESEPGECHHGWQYYASSTSEDHHRETMVLAQLTATNQAHLRSHSDPGAGQVLLGPPYRPRIPTDSRVVSHPGVGASPIAAAHHRGSV